MRRWTRIAGVVATGKVMPMALVGFGTAMLTFITVRLVTGPTFSPAALIVYPFMGLWLTIAGRLAAIGLYVSPSGVRIRRLLRTHTVEWSRIGMFISAPGVVLGGEGARHAIWLHLTDGSRLQTPIHHNTPGLAVAVYRHDIMLPPTRYDAILADLRQRLQARA